jgi:hypothetical protein
VTTWQERVAAKAAVRARIASRLPLFDDPKTADQAHLDNWADLNSVFCEATAMGLVYFPSIFSQWPAGFHDNVCRQYATGLNIDIAGPRRRGKSKTFQAHQLKKMLTVECVNTLHLCYDGDLVLKHAQPIINEFENNKLLQRDFNITPGPIQQQDFYQIHVGKAHKTLLTFEWCTRDKSPRGGGYGLVGVDDIDDPNDSAYMMSRYGDMVMSSVYGTLEPFSGVQPQFIVIGNLTGRHCFMMRAKTELAVKEPERWVVIFVPAIETGETQEITEVVVGESIWPEKFSTIETRDTIRQMNMTKARSGDMELMNVLVDASDILLGETMLQNVWHELPEFRHAVSRVYVDASQKEREVGDEWAIGTLTKAVDGQHKGGYFLERGRLSQLNPKDALQEAVEQFIGRGAKSNPQCEEVCKESITTKGRDPWLGWLQDYGRERNINIPVREITTHGMDKRQRGQRAYPVFAANAFYVPANPSLDVARGLDQMRNFTGKDEQNMHAVDDFPDMVFHGVIDLQGVTAARRHQQAKPYTMRDAVRAAAA